METKMRKIDATRFVHTPFDRVVILWVVDGSSGRTICEAWRAQFEIDDLTRAGYTVITVEGA